MAERTGVEPATRRSAPAFQAGWAPRPLRSLFFGGGFRNRTRNPKVGLEFKSSWTPRPQSSNGWLRSCSSDFTSQPASNGCWHLGQLTILLWRKTVGTIHTHLRAMRVATAAESHSDHLPSGAGGGIRTLTPLRASAFETDVSALSPLRLNCQRSTSLWCRGRESNPHDHDGHDVLSVTRIPFRHPGFLVLRVGFEPTTFRA